MKVRRWQLSLATVGLLALIGTLGLVPFAAAQDGGVVNVYSTRHYGAIELPFEAFTEATGIQVRVSQGTPRDLLERLRAEGEFTPADVFLAIDAGVLDLATEEGLLQPIESDVLNANIAPEFRDPDGHWYGLSIRTRTAVYNTSAVSAEELAQITTYADLADPMWEGRLCMRPASHIYTVSLVSSLIYHLGEEAAEEVVAGWVANDPIYINSDTRQIESVGAGECDVAVVNHYYMGQLVGAENPVVDTVAIAWLNQPEPGVFFNINGAGVTANANNRENAIAFIEWMSSLEGQAGTETGLPGSNYEFPTNPEAAPNEIIAGFGEFVYDTEYSLWSYGEYQQAAVELLERTGYGFDETPG